MIFIERYVAPPCCARDAVPYTINTLPIQAERADVVLKSQTVLLIIVLILSGFSRVMHNPTRGLVHNVVKMSRVDSG